MKNESTLLLAMTALVTLGTYGCGRSEANTGDPSTRGASPTKTASATEASAAEASVPGFLGSCDKRSKNSGCTDLTIEGVKAISQALGKKVTSDPTKEDAKKLCSGLDGISSETACSSQKLVGSCNAHGLVERYYSDGPLAYTAATAKKDCGSKGQWIAP